MEPTCDFCGIIDKNRCRTRDQAAKCSEYFRQNEEKRGIDFDMDFGFTEPVVVEDYIKQNTAQSEQVKTLRKQNKDLDNRLQTLYNTIIPFLERIKAGGEKDIHWPNRAQQIETFQQKLTNIVEGKK